MTVRGKAAGAAVTAAAPELKLVPGISAAAGRKELERRRQAAAAKAAARRSAPPAGGQQNGNQDGDQDGNQDQGQAGPGRVRSALTDQVHAANAGGGFLLGLGAWVVAVNYMQGGVPQVKRLFAAKLLNKTK